MITQRGRTCKKCGADDWRLRSRGSYDCAQCNRDRCAKWARSCPEKKKTLNEKWYRENRRKLIARAGVWKRANPDKVLASRRANIETDRMRARADYAANTASILAKNKEWHNANPESRRAAQQRHRARKKNASGNGVTTAQWQECLAASLGICAYCNRRRRLTLDHIDPLRRGGTHDIENAAAVCHSCNCSKQDTPLLLWLTQRSQLAHTR